MKKSLILLVLLVLVVAMASACATKVSTPTMTATTSDPFFAYQLVKQPKQKGHNTSEGESGSLLEKDYSQGALPACAEAYRANPQGNFEYAFGPDGGYCRIISDPEEYNKPLQGIFENNFTFVVKVVITPSGQGTPTSTFRIQPDQYKRTAVFPDLEYHIQAYNAGTGQLVAQATRVYTRTRQDAYSELAGEYTDFVERIQPK